MTDIAKVEEYSDISATETFYSTLPDSADERISKNYEAILKLIDKHTPIINIFKKIIEDKKCVSQIEKGAVYKDSRGLELYRLHKGDIIYKGLPWFYPHTFTHMEIKENEVYPHLYSSLLPATYVTMVEGGGLNAYSIVKELRLLCLTSQNISRIVKTYLEPLISGHNNLDYYNYIKNHIMEPTDSNASFEVLKFYAFLTNALGYDGTYAEGTNTTVYQGNEYMLNTSILGHRQATHKYDWETWGMDAEYILPIETFNLNIKDYLTKNVGFSIYNFYKKMLLATLKIDDKFDFATLNVNHFQSINAKDSVKNCIGAAIGLMKEYDLRFLCLQNSDINDELTTNLVEAETLHIVNRGKCGIISTARIDIVDADTEDNHIVFAHPHFRGKKFINVNATEVEDKRKYLKKLGDMRPDVILGTLGINRYNEKDYAQISAIGYATNDTDMESTSADDDIVDYILTRLPKVLSICMVSNYKYSNHRLVLGKYIVQ